MFNYIHYIITVILFIVFQQISTNENVHCVQSDCNCTDGSSYECPNNVTINIDKTSKMTLDCGHGHDFSYLPKLNRPDIKTFHYRNCSMPDGSFREFLSHFNISQLGNLYIFNPQNEQVMLTKESFKNLSALRKFTLEYSNLSYENDFLGPISNLTVLSLNNNGLDDVGINFTYTPNLVLLDLSRNELGNMLNGIFSGLGQLKRLDLFNNNITELDDEVFVGLESLYVLELSNNQISKIHNETFSPLVELRNLSLQSNHLEELPEDLFKMNTKLESVRLGRNPNLKLSDYLLADLKNLKTVSLSYSNLKSVPDKLFDNDKNLVEVYLDHNALETLPSNAFRSTVNLKYLNLGHNRLKQLPDNVFNSLENLERLDLSGNDLMEINERLFNSLNNLMELSLADNSIAVIHLNAFQNTPRIVNLNLARNQYSMEYIDQYFDLHPFSELIKLEVLDLSGNLIKTFHNNLLFLYTALRTLNLSHNQIEDVSAMDFTPSSLNKVKVDLSFNKIATFDVPSNLSILSDYSKTDLNILNNPLKCDCRNYDFVRYLKQDNIKTIEIESSNLLECSEPNELKGEKLKTLNLLSLVCELQHPHNTEYDGCAEGCDCYLRSHDTALVMNCSYRNMKTLPKFEIASFTNQTVLNLMGNSIDKIPEYVQNWKEYRNVSVLYLNGNGLMDVAWIPPAVQELHLDGNKLTHLKSSIIAQLKKNFASVTLGNNPWTCDCTNTKLQKYLQLNQRVDANLVFCANSSELILHVKDICPSHLIAYLSISFTVILVALMLVAFYYRYEQEIKVWLYAKNLLLWLVTEEELDKDKQYDVFVSYSHKDEEFVVEKLLPELESGPNPYSVCVHYRNWVPGEFISRQLTNSVLNSRRTLVILSNSFVDSVWGKMEFRTAHTEAIREGRARVIVLILGDLNEDLLDDELKVYLKTNTYIKWGDPYFWNKLKYALPHRRNVKNQQKLQNIMLKIDKLELKSVESEN